MDQLLPKNIDFKFTINFAAGSHRFLVFEKKCNHVQSLFD